ncbi:hypothetical protein C3747_115g192 [Trypanosoma cruzi]|uniref:Uncharacterized protein n=1 Tax=Trypanosoma cruzi TaxID=5693 RepID=A0A2V2WI55_TRYCR|nr:hypothetical protein C3747_115g192 [Trypanosoma cruzi]
MSMRCLLPWLRRRLNLLPRPCYFHRLQTCVVTAYSWCARAFLMGTIYFFATTMQSVMHHNSSVMPHLEGELKAQEDILQLLVVARSTAYHRCSEDIQASVSPLVAELFSLLDTFSSSSMVPLDKKKVPERRCKLSGLRLNSSDTSEVIDAFVKRYWNVAIGSPIPP